MPSSKHNASKSKRRRRPASKGEDIPKLVLSELCKRLNRHRLSPRAKSYLLTVWQKCGSEIRYAQSDGIAQASGEDGARPTRNHRLPRRQFVELFCSWVDVDTEVKALLKQATGTDMEALARRAAAYTHRLGRSIERHAPRKRGEKVSWPVRLAATMAAELIEAEALFPGLPQKDAHWLARRCAEHHGAVDVTQAAIKQELGARNYADSDQRRTLGDWRSGRAGRRLAREIAQDYGRG